ncbi:MAG TPA: lipid-A-disaccharide synthase [Candidatus Paceibacterota bacterium]|nr:lipid-A-disaccharide synthase [Verrucomicrobiota bacterium]HRZ44890.1 lipid-A-disaccharide synthase [Candidatus Paceibacterota bacterium]HRZ91526.1 lipid-A-disaccharide synthase [Candidatus Paceibacterota bacterium]
MNPRHALIIAGEASGDRLGAELVCALSGAGDWRFWGAGGACLAAAGVELAFDLTAHAVVGLWEVVKHYPELRARFQRLLRLARDRQPDLVILVDYPGFNLRFAAALKQAVRSRSGPFLNWRPRIAYFVSPQLWAWHGSRVRQIARDVDLMLCIFPFEPAWYAARAPDLAVQFVGHPLVDRYGSASKAPGASGARPAPAGAGARTRPDPSAGHAVERVLMLPGSREREIDRHLPVLLPAAARLSARASIELEMVLPNERLAEMARARTPPGLRIRILTGGLESALARADIAIASSGTVTMECAFFGVPAVVIYRTSASTYWLGKRFIRVPYLAMPNLLAGERVYPELIQRAATPEAIAREAGALLDDTSRRQAIRQRLAGVIEALGPPGACQRAAQAIQSLFPGQAA